MDNNEISIDDGRAGTFKISRISFNCIKKMQEEGHFNSEIADKVKVPLFVVKRVAQARDWANYWEMFN